MKKIKAVIFDMDGVLIDAKDWHYEALNLALLDFGINAISLKDHLTIFDGLSTDQKLSKLLKDNSNIESLKQKINDLKQKYTYEIAKEKLQPNHIHIDLLKKLQQEGYKMAVCSNSIRKTVEIFIRDAQLLEYMDFMLSNEDVKNKKPHPDIYIEAMKKLNLEPCECLILEDNFNGIKAARDSKANVLEIKDILEVNYQNVKNKIKEIENVKN
jgi:beta-phosphoglucomutase